MGARDVPAPWLSVTVDTPFSLRLVYAAADMLNRRFPYDRPHVSTERTIHSDVRSLYRL
jgi:hypothetical protein